MAETSTAASQHKRQFILFCIVGVTGVLVNMSLFAMVLWALPKDALGKPYTDWFAMFVAWIVSVATNFVLNDRLTFADHDSHHDYAQRLWRYYVGAASGFLLQWAVYNLALALLAENWASWPAAIPVPWPAARKLIGNFVGIGVGTIANYVVVRFWVFRKRAA